MWKNLFKPVDMLQKGLAASWTRNAVIRNNIANIETPGFKSSHVEFESLMARAILGEKGFVHARTHSGHREIGPRTYDPEFVFHRIVRRDKTNMRFDENNVDIEAENVKLAQNSLYYNTLVEKMNSELRRLRMAITEGR